MSRRTEIPITASQGGFIIILLALVLLFTVMIFVGGAWGFASMSTYQTQQIDANARILELEKVASEHASCESDLDKLERSDRRYTLMARWIEKAIDRGTYPGFDSETLAAMKEIFDEAITRTSRDSAE